MKVGPMEDPHTIRLRKKLKKYEGQLAIIFYKVVQYIGVYESEDGIFYRSIDENGKLWYHECNCTEVIPLKPLLKAKSYKRQMDMWQEGRVK
jgi:hypothetical protein